MNISNYSEIIYSILYILLSRNEFQLAYELSQVYHLTTSTSVKEKDLNVKINSLKTEFEFVKWQKAIKSINFYLKKIFSF